MNELTSINLRIDKQLKTDAEQLFAKLGMNMTTALNIFLRQAVREQAIPFSITAAKNYDQYITEKLAESELKVVEGTMKYHTHEEVFGAIEEIINDAKKNSSLR